MIEIDNRMRSIRSSLTCQTPSDSIRFFRIAYDRTIVRSHCPIFHPIFKPIRQTIKKSGNGAPTKQVRLGPTIGVIFHCHPEIYSAVGQWDRNNRAKTSGINRSGNPTIVRVSLADSTRDHVLHLYHCDTHILRKWTSRDKGISHVR